MSKFLIFLSILFFYSCVGTIEETNFEITEVVADAITYEDYVGIDEAIAISHHQIEVYFNEFNAVQSDKVAYQIYYDGAEFPIFLPGNSITPRADGRLMYTVSNLNPNREYYFEVQVTNLISGESSLNDEKRGATTFANKTADFLGIQSVTHQPGPDGLNFIKVSWVPAKRESNGLIPLPSDAAKYEVTVLSASRQLSDFDNILLGNDERKVTYFNESVNYGVIGGLISGATYYVRVRAIHQEYAEKQNLEGYRHEENNKYIEITMLTNDSNSVEFDGASFQVNNSSGAKALNSATASWQYPTGGAYNHFRLYYKGMNVDQISLIEEELINIRPDQIPCEMDGDGFLCRRFEFTENSGDILDLNNSWRYYFILAVCLDETCQNYKLSKIQNIVTKGDLASFSGFESYKLGESFNELSKLTINVTPPNLNAGILDSIIIYFDIDNGDGNYVALNLPEGLEQENLESSLSLLPYNFLTDDEIFFDGIDVDNLISSFLGESVPKTYNFKYKRYSVVDGAVEEDFINNTFVVTPQLEIVNEPIVIETCIFDPSLTKISWIKPQRGIFTHFKLEIIRNNQLIDTFYLDDDTLDFYSMNYFLDSGSYSGDLFTIKISPVILYEGSEIDPIDYNIPVPTVNCESF